MAENPDPEIHSDRWDQASKGRSYHWTLPVCVRWSFCFHQFCTHTHTRPHHWTVKLFHHLHLAGQAKKKNGTAGGWNPFTPMYRLPTAAARFNPFRPLVHVQPWWAGWKKNHSHTHTHENEWSKRKGYPIYCNTYRRARLALGEAAGEKFFHWK